MRRVRWMERVWVSVKGKYKGKEEDGEGGPEGTVDYKGETEGESGL